MKCIFCGHDGTEPRLTLEFLSRGQAGVVIHGVPSEVCPNCGEVYHLADVTRRLLQIAESALADQSKQVIMDSIPLAVARFEAA